MAAAPAHVVLSPHLDDAVLGCGGAIAAWARSGLTCVVVTVCAGQPASGFPIDQHARALHARWGLPDDRAVTLRRAEDAAALARIGAAPIWLDLLDAMYRRSAPAARWRRALARLRRRLGLAAEDGPVVESMVDSLRPLRERWPAAVWWAPLGIGRHPDHLAVHAAARRLAGDHVRCYEDFPYAAVPGALAARLGDLGGEWRRTTTPIDDTLATKIAAIRAYASQVPTLFRGGANALETTVEAFARGVDPALPSERWWTPPGAPTA